MWQATVTGRTAQSQSPTGGQSPASGALPSPGHQGPPELLPFAHQHWKLLQSKITRGNIKCCFLDRPTSFIIWSTHPTWISGWPRRSSRHLQIANWGPNDMWCSHFQGLAHSIWVEHLGAYDSTPGTTHTMCIALCGLLPKASSPPAASIKDRASASLKGGISESPRTQGDSPPPHTQHTHLIITQHLSAGETSPCPVRLLDGKHRA